jgi:hypothetical protein
VSRITELDMLFKLMMGDERVLTALTSKTVSRSSPDGYVSWGSSRSDWKTVAVCLLLFAKPALSRAEVARGLEQAMQLRDSGSGNERLVHLHNIIQISSQDAPSSHHQSIVRQLVHGDVGPLLKSLYERSQFGPSPDTGMDMGTAYSSVSATEVIHKVASAVVLLTCTHIAQLLQLVGVLDSHTGDNSHKRGGAQSSSRIQKEFVENIATEAVTELAELNFPIEVNTPFLSV